MSAYNPLLHNITFCVEHRNKSYLLSANDVYKLPNPDYSPSKISGKKKGLSLPLSLCAMPYEIPFHHHRNLMYF